MTSKNSKKSSFRKIWLDNESEVEAPFIYVVVVVYLLCCVWLLQPHGLQPARLLCPWDFPGKNAGVGCHFLLRAIFPTQGLNPGLLHCRQILYRPGKPPFICTVFHILCFITQTTQWQVPHPSEPGRATFKQDLQKLLWAMAKLLCGETDTEL